jgi:hypothetical protein
MLPPTMSSRINMSSSKEADEGRLHNSSHNRHQSSKSHSLEKKTSEYDDEDIEVDCYGAKKGPSSNTNRLLKVWIMVIISIAFAISLVLSSTALIRSDSGTEQSKPKLSYTPSDCLNEPCSIDNLWSWASKKEIVARLVQIADFPCPTCGTAASLQRFHPPRCHSLFKPSPTCSLFVSALLLSPAINRSPCQRTEHGEGSGRRRASPRRGSHDPSHPLSSLLVKLVVRIFHGIRPLRFN